MKKTAGIFVLFILAVSLASAATITVTKPAAGDTWTQGQTYAITWTMSGQLPANVRIELRNQANTAVVKTIADPAPNSGSYQWLITADIPAGGYRVRVKAKGVDVWNDSPVFNIAAPPPPPAASITVTKPASGDKWHKSTAYTITWTKTGTMPNTVKISLVDKTSTAVVKEIADGVANSGTHSWTIPSDIPFGDYRVRVLVKTTDIKDDSDTFSIAVMSLPPGTMPEKEKTTFHVPITPVGVDWNEYDIKGWYQNWSNMLPPGQPVSAFQHISCGYPPNTDSSAHAHVGHNYHSFQYENGYTGWVTDCYRSKVYFLIDQFQGQSAKLISAKMHLKQVCVQRLNDTNTSCAVGYFIMTALWTDWYNPPITTVGIPGSNGLDFGSADYTIDITSIVKSWLNGTQMNYGLLLTSQEVTWGQTPKICCSAFDVNLIVRFKKD